MLPPNRIESNQKSLDIKTGVAIVAVVQVENVSYYHRSEDHVNVVNASQAEIGQLDLASRRDQHVLRFEVSVNDTIGVQEINSTQNLVHQVLHSRNKFTLNQSNKQRVKSPRKKSSNKTRNKNEVTNLDSISSESRWRAPFQVRGQILIHVFKDHVEDQLLFVFEPRAVANVQQPVAQKKREEAKWKIKSNGYQIWLVSVKFCFQLLSCDTIK